MRILLLLIILTASCAKLTEPLSNNLIVYGDSISTSIWTSYLGDHLGLRVLSYALSGSAILTRNSLGGYSQMEQMTQHPMPTLGDTVILFTGHNDAINFGGGEHLAIYSNALDIMSRKLSTTGARVYLGTPLTTTNEARFYKNSLIAEYADINRSIAAKYGLGVIDFNQKYHQGGTNTQDGLHQTVAGDWELFRIAYEEIKK